jgi:putative ATP-grasp target RiPP
MTGNDLTRQADHFPLDGPGIADPAFAELSCDARAVRPFGLRYATAPPPSSMVEVDIAKISYDPVRQISLVTGDDDSLLPAMKHTSTTTKTSTGSHDRQGADSDTDASGR